MRQHSQSQGGGGSRAYRVPISLFHGAVYAPHIDTVRITLGPGATKAWHVQGLSLHMQTVTIPSAAVSAQCRFSIQKDAGAELDIMRIEEYDGLSKQRQELSLPVDYWLTVGDGIRFYTEDLSTGGTLQYTMQCLMEEYDV